MSAKPDIEVTEYASAMYTQSVLMPQYIVKFFKVHTIL